MDELITYSKQLIIAQSEELIIEESKKNPQKFEPIYIKYYKPLFRSVLNRVGDQTIAADLISNVFFKALQNIEKFEYKGFSIYSWLYRIALNECNEHFRKKGGKRVIVLDQTHHNILIEEIAVFDEDVWKHMVTALKRLNESDLQIIEMRFFEELPFKVIGQIIGITEGHSKVRLYRAVERLRKFVKKS